ncbi:OmpA family protein [Candidatus Falkowbacteria bacterium]|nr:OmpA family protein [Candidatus Falkowbacteria bacterium]
MKKIIGAIIIVILVVGAMFAYKLIKPKMDAQEVEDTSAAKDLKGEVRIALDSWVGYFPLRSSQFKQKMRQAGWNIKITDDGADYHARAEKFAKGEYDIMVATVDSYVLNSAKNKYPGVITVVIDESFGGDSIMAMKTAGESIDAFKNKTPKVAFTPDSPSHHLLKAVRSHFGAASLLPPKGSKERVETKGSEEALKLLLSGQVQVAVLWEPDVSRAQAQPGIVKLMGTEQARRYIVDVLVVRREFLKEKKDVVKLVHSAYFRALKYYQDNPEELKKELGEETKLTPANVADMLKGVIWVNLTQNCHDWFGVGAPNESPNTLIVDTIDSTVAVLIDNNDFSDNPLPDNDPYKIFNVDILQDLFLTGVAGFQKEEDKVIINSLETKFEQFTEEQWSRLKVVGTLKVNTIVFQSGTTRLSLEGKEELDRMVTELTHFPSFRVKIMGHTSVEGDPEENKKLSLERAQAVAQYLMVTYNIDANRLLSIGMGGEAPLPQLPDETERVWYYRLSRVEIVLVKEEI